MYIKRVLADWLKIYPKKECYCAHYAMVYDPRLIPAARKMLEAGVVRYSFSGDNHAHVVPSEFMKKHPNVSSQHGGACYAPMKRLHHFMNFENQHMLREAKEKKKRTSAMNKVSVGAKHAPHYVLLDIARMSIHGRHNIKEMNGKSPSCIWKENCDNPERAAFWQDVKEWHEVMWENMPLVKDAVIGTLDYERMWNEGIALDVRKLNLQKTFYICMMFRYIMEQPEHIYSYRMMKEEGFTKQQAMWMTMFTSGVHVANDGKGPLLSPNYGHDLANGSGMTEKLVKAIMNGTYAPVFNQPDDAPNRGFDNGGFYLNKAIEALNTGRPADVYTKIGLDGWGNARTVFDLKKIKGYAK